MSCVPKGVYAFIDFKTQAEVDAAIAGMNQKEYKGNNLTVEKSSKYNLTLQTKILNCHRI